MVIVRMILRTAHILGGVFWVGSVFAMVMAIVPVMRSASPGSGAATRSINPRLFSLGFRAAIVTLLSGVLMYIFAFLNLQTEWLSSGSGISITVGAIAGIVAFVYAGVVLRPTISRLGALNREVAAAGGQPNQAQSAELESLSRRQTTSGRIFLVLLVISTIGMAAADAF